MLVRHEAFKDTHTGYCCVVRVSINMSEGQNAAPKYEVIIAERMPYHEAERKADKLNNAYTG
jgi:hypothetical protein